MQDSFRGLMSSGDGTHFGYYMHENPDGTIDYTMVIFVDEGTINKIGTGHAYILDNLVANSATHMIDPDGLVRHYVNKRSHVGYDFRAQIGRDRLNLVYLGDTYNTDHGEWKIVPFIFTAENDIHRFLRIVYDPYLVNPPYLPTNDTE